MGNKNSSEDKTNSGSNQQKQEDNLSALDEHPVTGSNKQEQEQNMTVLEKLHVAFNSHYDAVERFSEFTTTQQKTADEMMNLKFSEDEAAKNNREDLFMKCSSHLQKEQEISESLKASLFKLYDSINENLKESGYSVLCTPALVGANEHPEKPAQENINRDANITVLEKNPKRITSKKKEIEEEDIEKQKKHQPKNEYTETILLQAKGYVEQLEEKITNLDAYISAEKKELEEKYKNHTETILIQAKIYVEQLEGEITNLNAYITAEKKGLEEKCKKSAEYADHLRQQLNKNIQRKNETTEYKDKKRRGEIEKQEKQEIKNKSMVQVLHSYKAERFKSIEKDLIALIGSRLKGLQFIKCSKQSSIDPSLKLIVLSILTSRLGTDASNAITDIENLKNTALVLIHLKESHSLPMQRSSDILTDEKFQGLGGIFDFANGDGKGFYQCSMNEESLLNICQFLQMEPGH